MTGIGTRQVVTAAVLTALAMLATVGLLAVLGPDWARFAPATCTATRCFCETPRIGDLFLQPSDSWSAFGYVFVGLADDRGGGGPIVAPR